MGPDEGGGDRVGGVGGGGRRQGGWGRRRGGEDRVDGARAGDRGEKTG